MTWFEKSPINVLVMIELAMLRRSSCRKGSRVFQADVGNPRFVGAESFQLGEPGNGSQLFVINRLRNRSVWPCRGRSEWRVAGVAVVRGKQYSSEIILHS